MLLFYGTELTDMRNPSTFVLRLVSDSIIFAPLFSMENLKKIVFDEEF